MRNDLYASHVSLDVRDLPKHDLRLLLLGNSYEPDHRRHVQLADVAKHQIETTGYEAGGIKLEAQEKAGQLHVSPVRVDFKGFAPVAYGAILDATEDTLVSLVDFEGLEAVPGLELAFENDCLLG